MYICKKFFLLCLGTLPTCMSAQRVCLVPEKTWRGHQILWDWSYRDGCKLLCGCLELNLGLLKNSQGSSVLSLSGQSLFFFLLVLDCLLPGQPMGLQCTVTSCGSLLVMTAMPGECVPSHASYLCMPSRAEYALLAPKCSGWGKSPW